MYIYLKTHKSLLKYIHTQCFMQNRSAIFSGYTITESHNSKYILLGQIKGRVDLVLSLAFLWV